MENKNINIGLWSAEAKTGKKYLKSSKKPTELFGKKVWVSVFKNEKTKDTQPDYNIVITEAPELKDDVMTDKRAEEIIKEVNSIF